MLALAWSVLSGCSTQPEASPNEKKLNPKDAERALQAKGFRSTHDRDASIPISSSNWIGNDTLSVDTIGVRSVDTFVYDTPGLANDRFEVKQVKLQYTSETGLIHTYERYAVPAPIPVPVPVPQDPYYPPVPVPQDPSYPPVPVPQDPTYPPVPVPGNSGTGNADLDGFILGPWLASSPAQAGEWVYIEHAGTQYQAIERTTPYSETSTLMGIDFYVKNGSNKSFCTASLTRSGNPDYADWRWRASDVSCTDPSAIPPKTEAGLTGERQLADGVSGLINGI